MPSAVVIYFLNFLGSIPCSNVSSSFASPFFIIFRTHLHAPSQVAENSPLTTLCVILRLQILPPFYALIRSCSTSYSFFPYLFYAPVFIAAISSWLYYLYWNFISNHSVPYLFSLRFQGQYHLFYDFTIVHLQKIGNI